MPAGPVIMWFRSDLRLDDNEALAAAVGQARPVIPVFIMDEQDEGGLGLGAAARWWLHGSLGELGGSLARRGSRLVLRRGNSCEQLLRLVEETGAACLCWNREHSPYSRVRDARVRTALAERDVEVLEGNGQLLFDPEGVRTRTGGPFQVFTPFWRLCRTLDVERTCGVAPSQIAAPAGWPAGDALDSWGLRTGLDWAEHFNASGAPGESGARRRLSGFLGATMDAYHQARDRPGIDGTSRLSAALRFGELTPRQVWAAVEAVSRDSGVMPRSRGAQVFLDEIGWREFAYHLLWHFPETPRRPLREQYESFPWQPDEALQRAWRRGRTGYPIVDAGMRQLWQTGWMHNRVRMIVASFLVKQLLQPWSVGAAWFLDTLVDADIANNTLGWQWSAGCGADAAPYFRIFNPVLQGERFDASGQYVRRWVPELARLPDSVIHRPWDAPPSVLDEAGVRLGMEYPWPIISPAEGRARALGAFSEWKALCGTKGTREGAA